ncbi:flagellar protein FlaG [Labrenzia sp. DG1229]|uniref:flagellar protein FlaG n=1 Tax=Labrenzia sp. DG1229 TaxID=681847 RepID=UPI00049131C3|nr:flagellar protein FlaG [Labrenzia sp. DG1229]
MLDTGIARPPSPTYTAITPVTRAPEKNVPAAKTDLPAKETVNPSSETQDGRRSADNEQSQRAAQRTTPQVERRNVVDPDSESLVFVATNTDTGQVLRQIPSETLLRLRVYAETVENQQTEESSQPVQLVV